MTMRRVGTWAIVAASVIAAAGCGTTAPGEGAACSTTDACASGLSCVADASGAPRCMRQCTRGSAVCDDGSACIELTTAGAVCWLGGATGIGTGCSGGTQCERGGVCVAPSAGASPVCAQACLPPSADFCAAGQTCIATMSGGGFCGMGGS